MSKVDQLRALREAAATAAPKSTKVVVHWHNAPDQIVTVPASTTYQYRDPDKRRAYMREYAKMRRALKAAERAANKEQGT